MKSSTLFKSSAVFLLACTAVTQIVFFRDILNDVRVRHAKSFSISEESVKRETVSGPAQQIKKDWSDLNTEVILQEEEEEANGGNDEEKTEVASEDVVENEEVEERDDETEATKALDQDNDKDEEELAEQEDGEEATEVASEDVRENDEVAVESQEDNAAVASEEEEYYYVYYDKAELGEQKDGEEGTVVAASKDVGQNDEGVIESQEDEIAVALDKDDHEEEETIIVQEDYCSEPDSGVCAYHNICYNTIARMWYTSASPIDEEKSPILNNMGYSDKFESILNEETQATCNEKFVPLSNRPYPSEKELVYQEGTTYFVCCWVNHFGHILLQMFTSAVYALAKIGLARDLNSNSINFVVDNRASSWGSPETILTFFEFLTKKTNKVTLLHALEEKAKQDGKDNICFEKLVVGMFRDNLVRDPHPTEAGMLPPDREVGMLQPLRDHLDIMHPLTKESITLATTETEFSPAESNTSKDAPIECTIALLQRKFENRAIGNFDEVVNATKEIFFEPKWNIRTVSFDGPSLESQYLTARSSMVFVSVTGTGSHMAMFLPDGGSSVEILHDWPDLANRYICGVAPYLSCPPGVTSTCPTDECKTSPTIDVDMTSYKETMEGVKMHILSKCDSAMESFLSVQ